MVIKADIEDIFVEGEDGSIRVSDTAPDVLRNAITTAKKSLNADDEYILRAVGEPRRALDFGLENLITIQTVNSTIFAGNHPELGPKILAIGVSRDGQLTETQVQESLESISKDVNLLSNEMSKSVDSSRSLRSIKQSKNIIDHNISSMIDEISLLRIMLRKSDLNEQKLISQLNTIEVELHNVLSSVYTFSQTIDQSLKDMGVIKTLNHHLQKYMDNVAIAIGLRHYIQHRSTLSLQWMSTYNHDRSQFEYDIGVLKSEVCNSEYYHGKPSDAAGNKYDPVDYYYENTSGYLIDIEEVLDIISEATNSTYENLKSSLQESHIEGVEITNQFHRIKSYHIEKIAEEQIGS